MTREEIIAIFPKKVLITQEIIDEGQPNRNNVFKCIGALTLSSLLPEELHKYTIWGSNSGTVLIEGGDHVQVEAIEGVNMMMIDRPIEVTLITR